MLHIFKEQKLASQISFQDFKLLPNSVDISTLDANKQGTAVSFSALLSDENLPFTTLEATLDNFFVSVPTTLLAKHAYIIFEKDSAPLNKAAGGPYRLYIPNPTACNTGELDECVNVKFLDRIYFSKQKGKDTRPMSELEHRELHESQSH